MSFQYTIPAEVRQTLGVGPEPVLQKNDGCPWKLTPKEYALMAADAKHDQETEARGRRERARREAEFLRVHKCEPKLLDPNTCLWCSKSMPLPPSKSERLRAIQASNMKSSGRRSAYYDAILRSDKR
ncbi:MAG: hypothetical protein JRN21_09270 [Nitrososphaerota archaeon]|nr:hypothetical protein [Nitrososphaerota archaeon]